MQFTTGNVNNGIGNNNNSSNDIIICSNGGNTKNNNINSGNSNMGNNNYSSCTRSGLSFSIQYFKKLYTRYQKKNRKNPVEILKLKKGLVNLRSPGKNRGVKLD
ncbi:hypothetical protein ACTA71_010583 [Dictyostelium dimigraforme]